MIDSKYIISVNAELGYSLLDINKVESALSSYLYYDTPYEQIASIVVGIARNHGFTDGNKRTAASILIVLTRSIGMKNIGNDDIVADIILRMVTDKQSPSEFAKVMRKYFK